MLENQNIEAFEETLKGKYLVVFGASAASKKTLAYCEKQGYKVHWVIDNNDKKWGTMFCGYMIKNPKELFQYNNQDIVILIASVYLIEIVNQLQEMGFTNVFSAHLCNMIESRFLAPVCAVDMHKIQELKEIVKDERSRQTIDRIVELRNQGTNRLYEVFAGRQYFQQDIFDFGNEVFLDCGSYRGEEIDYLNGLGCGTHRIYAFEPDCANYRFIADKYRKNENIICLNQGVWNISCKLSFEGTGTDGSMISDNGKECIQAVSIDEAIHDKVTFIKMDVEGAEMEAICGAEEIIKKYKPKLAICIYHKDKDLWEIPLKIKTLVKEYDVYIRQHSLGLSDTVMYAVCK